MAGQAKLWAHADQQLHRLRCLVLRHLCGSRRLLLSCLTLRRYFLRIALYLRGQGITCGRRPSSGDQVSLNCWTRLKDAMHCSWMYSVWIPGVAFLFGFQGKSPQFHIFLHHIRLIWIEVIYMCSHVVWSGSESLGLFGPAHLGYYISVSCVFKMSNYSAVWNKNTENNTHLQS